MPFKGTLSTRGRENPCRIPRGLRQEDKRYIKRSPKRYFKRYSKRYFKRYCPLKK